MDIIAEILSADKTAEDKLKAAEDERRNILEETGRCEQRFLEDAQRQAQEYRQRKQAETDSRINEEIEEIRRGTKDGIRLLDEGFEKNHKVWEDEIFGRIIAADREVL